MADTSTAPASGTSTTPTAPVAPAPSTPAVDASTIPSTTTPTSSPAAPVSPEPVTAPVATQEATPQPLFTPPADLKLAPEALTKFESFLRPKLVEGKVTLTGQEVLDQFAEQARDAQARWHKQITDTDKANETQCKELLTPAQLAEAESAVGFLEWQSPGFRDLSKTLLNNPVLVKAMAKLGSMLAEDVFESAGTPPPPPNKRTPAERMGYVKPKTN